MKDEVRHKLLYKLSVAAATIAAIAAAVGVYLQWTQVAASERKLGSWLSETEMKALNIKTGDRLVLLHGSDAPVYCDEHCRFLYPPNWSGQHARIRKVGSGQYVRVLLSPEELTLCP